MQVGDRVKVVKILQDEISAETADSYLGEQGTIIAVPEPDMSKVAVSTMVQVMFDDGMTDAFWPEELKRLRRKVPCVLDRHEVRIVLAGGQIRAVRFGEDVGPVTLTVLRDSEDR